MIDVVERAIRIAGVGGLLTAWTVAGFAAIRGRARKPGRGLGLASRLGALGSYLLAAVPYFIMWVVLWIPLPGSPAAWLRLILLAAGTALGSAGLGLYLWGRLTLADMYNVSSVLGAELYADHRLVTSGPFRYLRHPMYAAIAVAALGGVAAYRTWAMVFAVLWIPGLVVKARHEEVLLAAEFGQVWREYADRVPAWWPHIPITHHLTREVPL